MEEQYEKTEMKKQRKEKKKAEKSGRNMEVVGAELEDESAKAEEEVGGENKKTEDKGSQGREEASGECTAMEAVLRNDGAWDDVKGGWLDRGKSSRGKDGGGRLHEEEAALGRSVEE